MTKKIAAYIICLNFVLMAFIGCEGMATLFHGPEPKLSDDRNPGNNEETVPGVPSGLQTTTVSMSEIMVFWKAAAGANSYVVFYGTETAGSSQYGGTASSPSFTITGLQPGTTYYFTVKAGNNAGWSAGSSPVGGTTTALGVPSELRVSVQSSSALTVSWNAVSGASSYTVYRSTSSTGIFASIGTSTTASYTDTELTADTTYWYKVSAVNGTEGAPSAAVSGTTTQNPKGDEGRL